MSPIKNSPFSFENVDKVYPHRAARSRCVYTGAVFIKTRSKLKREVLCINLSAQAQPPYKAFRGKPPLLEHVQGHALKLLRIIGGENLLSLKGSLVSTFQCRLIIGQYRMRAHLGPGIIPLCLPWSSEAACHCSTPLSIHQALAAGQPFPLLWRRPPGPHQLRASVQSGKPA